MSGRHLCPVCGEYEFESESSYDVCPVCGWEDDVPPDDLTFETGANHCSLRVARELWKHGKSSWDFDNDNYTDADLGGRKLSDDWSDFDDDIRPEDIAPAQRKIGRHHKCPVCGKYDFKGYDTGDVCEVCGWKDDLYQERHPGEEEGCNIMSLNQARAAWAKGEPIE